MDRRTLAIEQYESINESDSLHSVYIVGVPSDEPSALRSTVFDELMRHSYQNGYTLENTEGVSEWGASSNWEEVLLRLSDAISTGAADAIIASLLAWAMSKHKEQKEQSQRYRRGNSIPFDENADENAPVDWAVQLEHQLQSFKREISKHFLVSAKVLELVECEQEEWKVRAIFRDNFNVKYLAEVSEEGYTKLSKLR